MRGLFIQHQLEFLVEAQGEGWHQEDRLSCALSVKNRGASPQPLADPGLYLALGDIKKIKQKDPAALKVVAAAELQAPAELAPGTQVKCPWEFVIDKNAAITDKGQSLYLVFGSGQSLETMGQLPVTVQPHPHIQVLLRILETTFRFVVKGQKSSKGRVQVKLKPSTAKRFTTVDDLVLSCWFEGEELVLHYLFHIKKFEATAATIGVAKKQREFDQRLTVSQYLFPGGAVNHEPLEAAVSEALKEIESGL